MKKILFASVVAVMLVGNSLQAFEAVGTLKDINSERGIIHIYANGQDRIVTAAKDIRVLGTDGKPLADGLMAKELTNGVEVTITVGNRNKTPIIQGIRLGKHEADINMGNSGKSSVGLKPLTEMTADDRYKGEDGGLYGRGKNRPPLAHMAAAQKQTERIVPLDAEGKPSRNGKIGLVSISMSNATMEYSLFKQIADKDPQKSPVVTIVDCAQGGQAMAEWVAPNAPPWMEADRRLERAEVSAKQVQVIWVKLANKHPQGELAEHGTKLQMNTMAVLHNAQARFPNLRIAYLSSRIYGGYASTPLNPEPYAYEGAFAVRWLIQAQINGNPDLQYSDANGLAKAPLLLWGPYFWADGTVPRKSDGLIWERADLGGDGTHPSDRGLQKVANMLLNFFKEDDLASKWYLKK